MAEWISIAPRMWYLTGCLSPLSAEVALIQGDRDLYVFDTGFGEQTLRALQSLPKPPVAILSHFHQDHAGNCAFLPLKRLYAGKFTIGKTGFGVPVTSPLEINDGLSLRILPIPTSHAKDSLALEVNGEWLFLGDAAYCGTHHGRHCYNVSQLQALIRFLEQSPAEKLLLSHGEPYIQSRQDVLALLKASYAERDPHEAFIYLL